MKNLNKAHLEVGGSEIYAKSFLYQRSYNCQGMVLQKIGFCISIFTIKSVAKIAHG